MAVTSVGRLSDRWASVKSQGQRSACRCCRENQHDIVPALDAAAYSDRPDRTTVTFDSRFGSVGESHGTRSADSPAAARLSPPLAAYRKVSVRRGTAHPEWQVGHLRMVGSLFWWWARLEILRVQGLRMHRWWDWGRQTRSAGRRRYTSQVTRTHSA